MKYFILISCLIGIALGATPKIDTGLTNILNSQETANICVTFANSNGQIHQTLSKNTFNTRAQKIDFLVSSLQNQAITSQQNVVDLLNSESVQYKSFWISNQVFISKADKRLIDLIANFSEVSSIEEEQVATTPAFVKNTNSNVSVSPNDAVEWNLEKIQTPAAWRISRGPGIVVATIANGVRYTHEALSWNYRFDYGWYEPSGRTSVPYDDNGSGTHHMGTIAGANGIGVAPDSKWITCKACRDTGSGSTTCAGSDLAACGQWMLCPTRPDGTQQNCAMAPDVVYSGWTYSRGNSNSYKDVIDNWLAAGIIPIFAIGNYGTDGYCGTVVSPGDMQEVIGVGSTDSTDKLASNSGAGPAFLGRMKPDLTAPGVLVNSAGETSDNEYFLLTGTSTAASHVAGVVALILSTKPGLDFDDVRNILLTSANTNMISRNRVCEGIPDTSFPNYYYGYGRLDALNALKLAQSTSPKTTIATTTTSTIATEETSTTLEITTTPTTTTTSTTTISTTSRSRSGSSIIQHENAILLTLVVSLLKFLH